MKESLPLGSTWPKGYPGPGRWHHHICFKRLEWLPPTECTGDKTCRFCYLPKGIIALNKNGSNALTVLKSFIAYYKKNPEQHPNYAFSQKANKRIKYIFPESNLRNNNIAMSESLVEPTKKRGRGRPRKSPVVDPTWTSKSSDADVELPVIQPSEKEEIVVENAKVSKPKVSRKKYGSMVDVYNGLFSQTRGGLTKDDLVKTARGRIVSKKQAENLKTSIDRLKNLKKQNEL